MTNDKQSAMVIEEKGISHLTGFTARDIEELLAIRHKKDIFVPQCKNGETWGARDLLKLDGWALLRTYSPLTTIGYEIKVSRQDFENDQKWTGYLDLCHLFYFVCPAGLIRATDLPSQVGIIWASKSGKLHVKRHAERREPDIEKQNRLLIYVLMARSIITNDTNNINKDPLTSCAEWIKHCDEKNKLAELVNGHIRKVYDDLGKREISISTNLQMIKDFQDRLTKLGITWDTTKENWGERWKVLDQINLLDKRIDEDLLNKMSYVGDKLSSLVQDIKIYQDKLLNQAK